MNYELSIMNWWAGRGNYELWSGEKK